MMKRIISVLSKLITVQSLLVLAIVLCIWSILAIQLDVSFLILNVGWEQSLCDKINTVYVNLSYSFIAGYIFYILTINKGDNIAVYPKGFVILSLSEGSRAGT